MLIVIRLDRCLSRALSNPIHSFLCSAPLAAALGFLLCTDASGFKQFALPLLASLYTICVARLDTLWNKWCKIWSKKEPGIVAAWLVLSEKRLST